MSRPDPRLDFRASIDLVQFHDFKVYRARVDPLTAFRTQHEIDCDKEDFFGLTYMEAGDCILRQGRNETLVRKGQIALWDSARPAVAEFGRPITQLCVHVPRSSAMAIMPGIEDLCGLAINGSDPAGQILVAHLQHLDQNIRSVPAELRPSIFEATLMLVRAVFRPAENALDEMMRRPALVRIQEYIRQNLANPELSVGKIAEELGYSSRYIHRLFSDFDFTVGDWIRNRRLQAARIMLASTPSTRMSIAQIADRIGFREQSHFSRAFKTKFGVSPIQFRNSSQGGDDI